MAAFLLLCSPPGRAAEAALLAPTSGWLVGPATILPEDKASVPMPCIMVNHFSNGFVVRFSGGGRKIFAMAVDFRQDVFDVARTYDVELGIGEFRQKVEANALDKGTILVNLQKEDGLYDALRGGKTMTLTIGSGAFDFALLGVRDGLERVEECYEPRGYVKVTRPEKPGMVEEKGGSAEAVPPAYSKAINGGKIEEPRQAQAAVPPPAEATPAAPDESAVLQQKMAQLDSMIQAAAKKLAALEPAAGQAAATVGQQPPARMPQAQVQPVPQRPQAQPAQAQPIGRPLASIWVAPAAKPEGMVEKNITARPVAATSPGMVERRWRAIRGTNLHEVLDVWAQHENARLIWQAGEEFAIEESISMKGTFEEAVEALLEQHRKEDKRPVGRIFIDPAMQQKVLLIESERTF